MDLPMKDFEKFNKKILRTLTNLKEVIGCRFLIKADIS